MQITTMLTLVSATLKIEIGGYVHIFPQRSKWVQVCMHSFSTTLPQHTQKFHQGYNEFKRIFNFFFFFSG